MAQMNAIGSALENPVQFMNQGFRPPRLVQPELQLLETFGEQLAAEGFLEERLFSAHLKRNKSRSLFSTIELLAGFQEAHYERYGAAVGGLKYLLGPKKTILLFGYDNFLCRPSAIPFDVTRHRPYPTVSPPYAGFWMRTFQASNKKLWRSLVDTDEERIALGVEIRRMRVARGWTKTEFGQALGFTPPESGQVTKLENGRRRVFTHEMLDVFDLAFQVESGYFGRFLANLRGEPMSHRFFPELVRVRAACRASARLVVMHALGQLSREHYEVTVRRAGQCGAMRLYYHSRADFPGDSRFVAPFETVLERQYQVLMLEPATISASV